MNRTNRNKIYYQTFGIILGLTFFIWLFRGFGILTFLPGLVLWMLILLSIVSGAIAAWQSSRRW
ncbi:MAG TPA: hypothetical protein IGS17_19120 [Oscillatoriales cyanobacterium M59_W2019_021]|nr:hypothetical protein [Oscillatoriales cyanobacterium M4454_W2019_049]HIK53009.1 hypothetical protein [Oscillatoriales cyanobacterium M59_W2019_021]